MAAFKAPAFYIVSPLTWESGCNRVPTRKHRVERLLAPPLSNWAVTVLRALFLQTESLAAENVFCKKPLGCVEVCCSCSHSAGVNTKIASGLFYCNFVRDDIAGSQGGDASVFSASVFINAVAVAAGTLSEAAAVACDLHLERRAGISWLIDPLKGHAGRLPTPVVDGSTCGAKKGLLFSEPPPHGKTDIVGRGWEGTNRVVRYQGVDLFFKK